MDKKRKREDDIPEEKPNSNGNALNSKSELYPQYKERPLKPKLETTQNDFIKLPNEILSIVLHTDSLKSNNFKGVKD